MGMGVQVLKKDMPYVVSLWCSKQAGAVNKMGLVLRPSLLFVEPRAGEEAGKALSSASFCPRQAKRLLEWCCCGSANLAKSSIHYRYLNREVKIGSLSF